MGNPKFPLKIARYSELLRPARTLWGQLLRYGFAGGIAAIVNIGVYAISWRLLHATWPRFDYQVANVIGFLCGNLVSYELSTRYVFNYRRVRRRTQEFGAFSSSGWRVWHGRP